MAKHQAVHLDEIRDRILQIRGQRVLLGQHLAVLYQVQTRALMQAVRRNPIRFPADFVFQLTWEETETIRALPGFLAGSSYFRYRPHAFTEHGAIMAANVLSSQRAIEASVYVVRAFVGLRAFIAGHKELHAKLEELERKLQTHDRAITGLMRAIRQLMSPEESRRRPIGFVIPKDDSQ